MRKERKFQELTKLAKAAGLPKPHNLMPNNNGPGYVNSDGKPVKRVVVVRLNGAALRYDMGKLDEEKQARVQEMRESVIFRETAIKVKKLAKRLRSLSNASEERRVKLAAFASEQIQQGLDALAGKGNTEQGIPEF